MTLLQKTYMSNMKSIILMAALLMAAGSVRGQVAKWMIRPSYNRIYMADGADLIMTDSSDVKTLWTMEGRRLASTRNRLHPFKEGIAVATQGSGDQIAGFYDTRGRFTTLAGCVIAHSFPFFSDGHLLVQEGYYYRYVNGKGKIGEGKYTRAYPFANGYASCFTYRNLLKNKGPYYLLLTKDLNPVSFSYDGRAIEDDDIDLISSVNDEGIGVVIAKRRVYLFNGKDKSLTPVVADQAHPDLKNQAKIEDELNTSLLEDTDTSSVLTAKCGKSDVVQIRFNAFLVPLSIKTPAGEQVWQKTVKPARTYTSPLRMVEADDLEGLCWEDREVLPPQFDKVVACIDDKAFVCVSGKCGALKVFEDEYFSVSLNKGNPINFRHQKFETSIRVDLPPMVSTQRTSIEMESRSGCEIDFTSCEKKNTEFGNYLQYNCVLNIPKALPDEMYGDARNIITYPVTIFYDGLVSPTIPVKAKAWHHKYYNVDVNESDISIHQGLLSFVLNIHAERYPDEPVYPVNVSIVADTLHYELEKVSESRYKCKVWTIGEGTTNIVVQLTEQGCPPAPYSFEVTYVKPAPKTKSKPATKENIVIRRKPKPAPVAKPTPHLEI